MFKFKWLSEKNNEKLNKIYDIVWLDYNLALCKVEIEKAIILALEEWNKWEEKNGFWGYTEDEINYAFMDLWKVWDYNKSDDLREQNGDCIITVLMYLKRGTYGK